MSSCNHCSLIQLKKEAQEKRQRIVVATSNAALGGHNVFRLQAGEKMMQYTEPNETRKNGCKWFESHFVAWYMRIPKNCRCRKESSK